MSTSLKSLSSQAQLFLKQKGIKVPLSELESVFSGILAFSDNKEIVAKIKESLKSSNVSTGLIYELLSKLCGETTWNVASSKQIEFHNLFPPQGPYWRELPLHLSNFCKAMGIKNFNTNTNEISDPFFYIFLQMVHLSTPNTDLEMFNKKFNKFTSSQASNKIKGQSTHLVKDLLSNSKNFDFGMIRRFLIINIVKEEFKDSIEYREIRIQMGNYFDLNEKPKYPPLLSRVENLEKDNLEELWKLYNPIWAK